MGKAGSVPVSQISTVTMKPLKIVLLIGLLGCGFCIGGCNEPIPNEISYRCIFADTSVDPFDVSDLSRSMGKTFVDELCASANLQFMGDLPITGNPRFDRDDIFELRSKTVENLRVTVLWDKNESTVAVNIQGNIVDPEANAIGRKSVEIFSKMFPGAKLDPFIARQGLFAP